MNKLERIIKNALLDHSIIYRYMYGESTEIRYNVITNDPIYNEQNFGIMFSYYISKCNNIGHSNLFLSKMLKINYHL